MREGLTVKKPKKPGIFRDASLADQVADFSYAPNDSLAQMIVDAWTNGGVRTLLLQPGNAKAMFAQRGFYWNNTTKQPIVISEDDYDNGYVLTNPNDLVFVLPNHDGTCPPGRLSRYCQIADGLYAQRNLAPSRLGLRRCGTGLKQGQPACRIAPSKTIAGKHSEVGGFKWHGR